MRILCLCLGNICRSPTGEAVLSAHAARAGLDLEIDSAGTGNWHVGQPPDARMQAAALAQGFDLSDQRARQLAASDFHEFDLILAMDAANLADARRRVPDGSRARLVRYLDEAGIGGDVPDPYFEGNFDDVVTLIDRAAGAIIGRISRAP